MAGVSIALRAFMTDRPAEFPTGMTVEDAFQRLYGRAMGILQLNEALVRELMAKLDACKEVKGKPLQDILQRVQKKEPPPQDTDNVSTHEQPKSSGMPPPPKPEQAKKEQEWVVPLIVSLAESLWGKAEANPVKYSKGRITQYRIGRIIIDSNKDRWFDFENNRGGNTNDLMKMLQAKQEPSNISAAPHVFPNEADIPLREFLYGKHLLRGTVSITAGLGGGGKSSKTNVEALAIATGKQLLRIRPPKPLRVMLINLEENRAELDRRLAAVMKHYELSSDDVGGRLFTKAKGEIKFKVAAQSRAGLAEPDEATINMLIELVRSNQIDVLIIDSLRKTHRVGENDNVAMGEVLECYERIAETAQCSVYLVHHNRKGNNGETTIDSLRGAVALVDAPRSIEIVETMTEAHEDKFEIEPGTRKSYFRTFNGKRNYAPPVDESDWFRFKSVLLDNDDGYGGGDDVGMVTPWTPPEEKKLLTPENIASIKQLVRKGEWREDVRADMWIGKPIAQVLHLDPERDKDKEKIKGLLSQLLKDDVLVREPGFDERRRPKTFIKVNNVSV